MARPRIRILKDGPYLVSGSVPLLRSAIRTDDRGFSVGYTEAVPVPDPGETYALCRCGRSGHKPFCDGTHAATGFVGPETADRRPYMEQASFTRGPAVDLADVLSLCAGARHCSIAEGDTWGLTEASDDPASRDAAVRTAQLCPAGRLVPLDKATGQPIEPVHEPSVVLLEDPELELSGPIWVRGGIPVESSDGTEYEVRNRVTLCRCGASRIFPFCDSNHLSTKFRETEGT